MDLHSDDFEQWLSAFGSNLDRWPATLRRMAVQHLAGSAESRAALRHATSPQLTSSTRMPAGR
jgi:hypothetical protein